MLFTFTIIYCYEFHSECSTGNDIIPAVNHRTRRHTNSEYEDESGRGTSRRSGYTSSRRSLNRWFDDRHDYVDEILVYRFYNGGINQYVGEGADVQRRGGQENSRGKVTGQRPVGDRTSSGGYWYTFQNRGGRPIGNGDQRRRSGTRRPEKEPEDSSERKYFYDYALSVESGRRSEGSGQNSQRRWSNRWFDDRSDYADEILVYRFYNGGNNQHVGEGADVQRRGGQENSRGKVLRQRPVGDRTSSGGHVSTFQNRGIKPIGTVDQRRRSGTRRPEKEPEDSSERKYFYDYALSVESGRRSEGSGQNSQRRWPNRWFDDRSDYSDEILVYRFYNGGYETSVGNDGEAQQENFEGSYEEQKSIETNKNENAGNVHTKEADYSNSEESEFESTETRTGTTGGSSHSSSRSEKSWWFDDRGDYVDEILVYRFYNGGRRQTAGTRRRGYDRKQIDSEGRSRLGTRKIISSEEDHAEVETEFILESGATKYETGNDTETHEPLNVETSSATQAKNSKPKEFFFLHYWNRVWKIENGYEEPTPPPVKYIRGKSTTMSNRQLYSVTPSPLKQ